MASYLGACVNPGCYTPFIHDYLERKPLGVNFVRIPAQFNRTAQLHASAYSTTAALGVTEQLHMPIFTAIHTRLNPLSSNAAIKAVFEANGVDVDEFENVFTSFLVDSNVR